MKVLLVALIGFAALATAKTSSETCQVLKSSVMNHVQGERLRGSFVHQKQARSVRSFSSCDEDDDEALVEPEFAGCLHPFVGTHSKLTGDLLKARLDCFHLFMKEADMNGDLAVTKEEFDRWTKLGFFDIVLAASEEGIVAADVGIPDTSVIIDTSDIVLTPRQESVLTSIISALQNENLVNAIVFLYGLLTNSDASGFDSGLIQSLSLLLTSITEGNIAGAVGQAVRLVVNVISDGGEVVGSVTETTTAALTSLVSAVIENNVEEIPNQIFLAVSGILADLTALTIDTTSAIATIIQTIIQGNAGNINADQLASVAAVIASEIIGVSDESRVALLAIVEAIRDENYDGITDNILIALGGILGGVTPVGSDTAAILAAIVGALINNNTEDALLNTAELYALLTDGGGSCRGGARVRSIGY